MNKYKNIVKKILKNTPLFGVARGAYRLVKNTLARETDTGFPTMPYRFTHEDALRVYEIVLSGRLQHGVGKEVFALEKEFAEYHNVKYALATNAGTSALELAVKAIGIRPGDEVIVPAYTFVATAQAVIRHGGIPVFADIDDTYTLSPKSFEAKITKRTKAVIPVHIFGNAADMDSIMRIARKHNLLVIEDACQGLGATYKGKKVGSIGDIGCFSFNEMKSIYTGQGGMLITNKKKYWDVSSMTRNTGQIKEDLGSDIVTTGNTFALTEMQASLARSILPQLDSLIAMRKKNYELFVDMIDGRLKHVRWYRILPDATPSYCRLIFMIDFEAIGVSRQSFIKAAHSMGIPMKEIYPKPLYTYSLFQKRRDIMTGSTYPFDQNTHVRYTGLKLPFAELFSKQQVGIEFSPYITTEHIQNLCTVLQTLTLKRL